jgi:hypothetical protein
MPAKSALQRVRFLFFTAKDPKGTENHAHYRSGWGITTENARHLAIEGGTVMNELIQQLKSRVGLDDDKAQSAVQTVVEFLKQRLPAPVASQLDSAISGGGMNAIKDKAEGIFGKKTA